MGTLGSVGITTNLMPAMTLGSGGIGGSITGDNITVTHLLNVKRLAYEVKSPPAEAMLNTPAATTASTGASGVITSQDIEEIVRRVLQEIRSN
jgi:acetaldehyde dehydrogenase (acetylating)